MATLRTLNENFRLDLEDYVEVNIYEAERLIDIVGGVELDVAPEFLLPTNECISMQNIFFPDTPPVAYLEEPGLQQLNGRQAVGYARFRKIDSDYKRMGRQREVLQAVFASFMDAGLTAKFNMMTSGLSAITTTLSNGEITNLAIHVAPVLGNEILQKQVPDPTTYRVNFYETSDTKVRVDLNTIIPSLHQFVYNDEYPFQPVKEIPGAPNSSIPLPAGLWRLDVDPSPTPIPTETSEATTTQASETPAPAA